MFLIGTTYALTVFSNMVGWYIQIKASKIIALTSSEWELVQEVVYLYTGRMFCSVVLQWDIWM